MSYFASSDQLPDWVRHVPSDWEKDWLKWHVSLSTERPDEEQRATLPYLSNEDIASWTGRLLREDLEPHEADSRLFQSDDVLFNKLRPYLAKVFHADFDGTSSGELLCLRPSARVDARYLFYVLTSFGFIDAVDSHAFGSKMPRADWETVGHQPLPLPRIEVQQRIARFLDEKTTRIDALIEKKQALLERLAEQRQALITRAVTKGLNPDVPMKPSGVDWLGDIPAHWRVIALNKLTTKITNGYVGPTRDMFVGEGVRYIQSLHIKENRIVFRDDYFVTEEWSNSHSKSILAEGDVLIVQTGDIGQVAHVRSDFIGCNCHALIICAPESGRLIGEYLSWLLCSDYGQQFLQLVKTGALHPHLNCGAVKFFQVLVPPVDEQSRISSNVRASIDRINAVDQVMKSSIEKLVAYRSALITAAVTGQLPELNG